MCIPWTDENWLQRSQPADPSSIYTLIDTRYNAQGETARTYREIDGWFYAVLPGTDNRGAFDPDIATLYGTTVQEAANSYLARNGYTLTEKPTVAA